MKTLILNWKNGENDPFSVLNRAIERHFRACGKQTEILQITDAQWAGQVAEALAGGVDFVYTWQGIGSTARVNDTGESFWDRVRVPLVCVHGDHPAHMPANHQLDSRHCFHLYTNADFARYANRHFRRLRSAAVIDIPQLFFEPQVASFTGEHFVVIKNVDDPAVQQAHWRQTLDGRTAAAYLAAAEALTARLLAGGYVEIHDVLDGLIDEEAWQWLAPANDARAYHAYHSALDFYVRSWKSIAAVAALADFPLHVYGRGWDRLAQRAPAHHRYFAGRAMADTAPLYASRYGLVDVSPSKLLHDRTRRAMVLGTAFLSSANLEDRLPGFECHAPLFYDFRPGELAAKCAAVVAAPQAHVERCRTFAREYHDTFHFRRFVDRLDELARSVDRQVAPAAGASA